MRSLLGGGKDYKIQNHNQQETASEHSKYYMCHTGTAAQNDARNLFVKRARWFILSLLAIIIERSSCAHTRIYIYLFGRSS